MIHSFSEPIHYVVLYINSPPHNSQFIESFATILSRSQKLFVHKFFKIKHFFLESLCTLSHIDVLGCLYGLLFGSLKENGWA